IVGGTASDGSAVLSGEIFNVATSGFDSVSNALTDEHVQPTMRVLPDGKVQIIGGTDHESIEIYDPAVNEFGAHAHVYPNGDQHPELVQEILNSQTRAALFHHGGSTTLLDREGQTITEITGSNQALVVGGTNSSGTYRSSASVLASSSTTVTTEKIDYPPGTPVIITGSGWQPNETVTLVFHEDPHINSENPHTFAVSADANGNFIFDQYAPELEDVGITYILAAKGQTSGFTAQTTFTDTAGASLDQWGNGPFSTPSGSWQNGDLNANNSHYREGNSVPFRTTMTGVSTSGTHTLDIQYDTVVSGKHAYDYLTSFDRTEPATPCSGISPCTFGNNFPIPLDPTAAAGGVTQVPGNFTIYNGTIAAA